MAERQLSFVPPEGQPPNPFLDPRNWSMILGFLAGVIPALTSDRIAWLATFIVAAIAYGVWMYGQSKSRQRTAVIDTTLKAVAPAQYGETVTVDLPNGDSKDVRVVPGNETPTKGQ